MNYPTPGILKTEQPHQVEYLYVPEYSDRIEFNIGDLVGKNTWTRRTRPLGSIEHFSAVDGFSNFDNGDMMPNDADEMSELINSLDELSDIPISRTYSDPMAFSTFQAGNSNSRDRREQIELMIGCADNQPRRAMLFQSYTTRTAVNYNCELGITVQTVDIDTNYQQYLAQSEHTVYRLGSIQIEIWQKPDNLLEQEIFSRLSLKYHKVDANGTREVITIPMTGPNVQGSGNWRYKQLPPDIDRINGFAGFTLQMLPQTRILVRLIPPTE